MTGIQGTQLTLKNIEGQRDIGTIPAAGGSHVLVTNDTAVDWAPVWSPDGRFLYFASDRGGSMGIWRIGIDEASGRATSAPEAVANGVDVSMDLPHLSDHPQCTGAFDPLQAVVKVSTACEAQRSAPRRLRDTEISYSFSVSPRPLWPFYGSQPVDRTSATGCLGKARPGTTWTRHSLHASECEVMTDPSTVAKRPAVTMVHRSPAPDSPVESAPAREVVSATPGTGRSGAPAAAAHQTRSSPASTRESCGRGPASDKA